LERHGTAVPLFHYLKGVITMDIMTALERLSGYLDGLSEYAEMTEAELNEMGEVESIIHDYIINKEREAN
jgi:hypothetical protein